MRDYRNKPHPDGIRGLIVNDKTTMKQTVNFCAFSNAFHAHNRADSFPGAALKSLFDYLEDFEDSTGDELELDVVALCCDFAHYDSATEAAGEYGWDQTDAPAEACDLEAAALEWLQENTTVIECPNGVIVQSF